MDAPRHRQSQGSQAYPADNPYGAYNPPAAADNGFSQNGYYAANGGGYRPRSPAVFYSGDEGTLSAFLSTLIRSARTTFAGIGSGAGGSQSLGGSLSSLLPKAPSNSTSTPSSHRRSLSVPVASLIPSSSTLGFVFLCCLWYLSSAFSSNTGKSILTRFRYPVTLTFIQFAFVAGYCVVVLSLREQFGSRVAGHHHPHHGAGLSKRRGSLATLGAWGIRRPSRHMFHGTFMMSLFQIAGHVFSSMAIARVPVSTVHTIKALSPLFTVLSYAALFGVRYTSATYVALLPLTIGVMLACSFDLRANAVGFLCALGSTFIFVAQNIFSKKLLPKENAVVSAEEKSQGVGAASGGGSGGGVGGHAKLDKLNLLFYSSGMAFILMIPIWLYSDASALFFGPATVTTNIQQPATSMSELVFFFFANGTVHFAQNLLAFALLARTSPVTYSIASLVKRIAVICIAIVWSGQHVSFIQAVGMTSTFVGLWMYNSAKTDVDKGEKRRTQVEKRMELSLPQTVGDARDLDGDITPPPSNLHAQAYGNPLSPTQKAPSYSVAMGASLPGDPRSPTLANGFTSGSQPHPAPAPPPLHSHAYEAQHPPQCSLSSSQHHAPSAHSYASPPLHQNGFAPAAPSSTNYLFASTNSTGPTINGAAGPRNRQASSSVSRDSSPAAMKTGGRHHPVLGVIQPVPTSLFGGGGGGGTATASGAGQLR
ncbi:triose-phosphate transporter family [Rhodotorula toruloides]|uniref:Triose-phosphate transporter family n=1 Tax=Rhodotorula toruloides TaxID=5286 RepID=A0A511KB83_RHOTO|nr:triose-phosphate transporter family [Rhodotorula toruloides]